MIFVTGISQINVLNLKLYLFYLFADETLMGRLSTLLSPAPSTSSSSAPASDAASAYSHAVLSHNTHDQDNKLHCASNKLQHLQLTGAGTYGDGRQGTHPASSFVYDGVRYESEDPVLESSHQSLTLSEDHVIESHQPLTLNLTSATVIPVSSSHQQFISSTPTSPCCSPPHYHQQ